MRRARATGAPPTPDEVARWNTLAKAGRLYAGSLRVFGEFFGKPFDNHHVPTVVSLEPDGALRIAFDEAEVLTVWEPRGVEMTQDVFRIQGARRVLWEWFSYGRPATPENLCVIDHTVDGLVVRVRETDLRDGGLRRRWFWNRGRNPAAELVQFPRSPR